MVQRITIIDYGSGNLRSVEKAFERAARELGAAIVFEVTSDPEQIRSADRLVLPGVGAFGACMKALSDRPGLLEAVEHNALVEARPFLGICVGMQLLADQGYEFGASKGLGWIVGNVRSLEQCDPALRSPHMGWSEVSVLTPHPVMDGLDGEAFYFAHSYHFEVENDAHLIGVCDYGDAITACMARDNIVGVQFHPEKSQHAGIALLKNFLQWTPA